MVTSAAEQAFGHIEADDLAELNSAGVALDAEAQVTFPTEPAALDAAVSTILRQIGLARADLERHREAFLKEEQALHTRYARIMEPIRQREGWLVAMGAQMALSAEFPGKSKSRKVAYGTYGRRQTPEHLTVCDEQLLLDWAKAHEPTMVQATVKERVPQKAAEKYYLATGDVPAGCLTEAAFDEAVLKPDLSITEGV